MNTNPFPDWSHDRRIRHARRRFCESVASLLTAGHIDANRARLLLDRVGVPFEDQCRIVRDALAVRELCPEPEHFLELETTA